MKRGAERLEQTECQSVVMTAEYVCVDMIVNLQQKTLCKSFVELVTPLDSLDFIGFLRINCVRASGRDDLGGRVELLFTVVTKR